MGTTDKTTLNAWISNEIATVGEDYTDYIKYKCALAELKEQVEPDTLTIIIGIISRDEKMRNTYRESILYDYTHNNE